MRVIILVLIFFSSALQANHRCSEIVMSGHPDYPPFHWRENNELIGASIAISSKIFEDLNIKHRSIYAGPWKRVLLKAQAGAVDFIPSLKITEDRKHYLNFSASPLHFNPVAIFVRQDFTRRVQQLSDLNGLVGSIELGNKHGPKIDDFVNAQSKFYQVNGVAENFTMLKLGRTDYFIEGLYTGRHILKKHQLTHEFKTATIFNDMLVHSAFSKSSPCSHYLNAYNDKLDHLRASGFVAEQFEHYEQLWLARHN